MMRRITTLLIALILSLVEKAAIVNAQSSDHGASLKLGTVKIIDQEFTITRLGELTPGKEGAFEVTSSAMQPAIATLSLYLWLEDENGAQVSAPSKGSAEGAGLHFHATPKAGSTLKRVTLRLRKDGKDERGSLPLDGHGHEHSTPHDGVVASLKGPSGERAGFIELKLHDDKGDLELWLGKDEKLQEPLDLSIATNIKVSFIDLPGKTATLKIRNQEKNEDEEGNPNIRNGKTNYFIFPGSSGEDSSWLKGGNFHSVVEVSFNVDGKNFKSEEFMLLPHTHADGLEH
jgi:hypothetical protein